MSLLNRLFNPGKDTQEIEPLPELKKTTTSVAATTQIDQATVTSQVQTLTKLDIARLIESASVSNMAYANSTNQGRKMETLEAKKIDDVTLPNSSYVSLSKTVEDSDFISSLNLDMEGSLSIEDSIPQSANSANSDINSVDFLKENYELLKQKTDISDVYRLVDDLQAITNSALEIQDQANSFDDAKESWLPLINTIKEYSNKKEVLKQIEAHLNQTINEMRDIHLKMYETFNQIKEYEEIRQANYMRRLRLATELEKKIALFQR